MTIIPNWNNFESKISRHFTVGEALNYDKKRNPRGNKIVVANILMMAIELDKVRNHFGFPIYVTSWYRPADINKQVGGVANSQHITGAAVDIFATAMDKFLFEERLDTFWGDKALGRGVRSGLGFTHLDLRAGGIRWDY